MDLKNLPPITWVSGKGGVGKSIVATALAHKLYQSQKRVLLVELGDESHFQRLFLKGTRISTPHVPTPSVFGFDYVQWSGESCLREYLLYFVKLESVVKLFFENRIMRAFVEVAPAVKELAITGKATSGPRKIGPPLPYDHIIIDAYATGHMLALLRAPIGMNEAVGIGPMGRESRRILDVLKDPKLTGYILVTLPEDLPVQEVLELNRQIKEMLPSQLPQVVLNKSWSSIVKESDWSESDIKTDFVKYIQWQMGRERTAESELSEGNTVVHKIPYFFESDPFELVRKIGEVL